MNPWIPWMYQYGVGGLAVLFTIFMLIRLKALNFKRAGDRHLLIALISGYFLFLTGHGLWIACVFQGGAQ